MKKFTFFAGSFLTYIVLTSSGGQPSTMSEHVSFPMLNAEIRHSMEENARQKSIKNLQITNTAQETYNQKEWTKFRETKQKIQDRLRFVDFAMQSIPTGIVIAQKIDKITYTEEKIFEEIADSPIAAVPYLPNQIQFVNDLQMTARLLAGIVLSYGAINQMETKERKFLLDFALNEVNRLDASSRNILFNIRRFKSKMKFKRNVLIGYQNRDRAIVESIIKNYKSF